MADAVPDEIDAIADALYALPPEEFVPARDDQVGEARSRGDRELAKAVARLRRPTRPAWLANLLARHRAEQLEGLISLAAGLAQAQRTLDGAQLRTLSSQRNRAVAAMAREAGRLAQGAGSPATEAQLRELHGILEAALAQPEVAQELRAGRLTRTLRYTGFGPESAPDAVPTPPPRARPEPDPQPDEDARAQERAAVREALADAERSAREAGDARRAEEDARADARERHADARGEVARLAAELEAARERERGAAEDERSAATALRAAARAVTSAEAEVERLRARLEALEVGPA